MRLSRHVAAPGGFVPSTRSRSACAPCGDRARAPRWPPPRAATRVASPRARTPASMSRHGAAPATSPASVARAKLSAAARSTRPSSPASSRACSASPSDRRAQAIAVSRSAPASSTCRATSSIGGASNRTTWQRERIVGSTSTSRRRQQDQVHERGRLLQRLEHPVGRLVAELVRVLDHEHAAARLERGLARRRHDGAVDVADQDLVRAARRDPGQVRMRARHHAHTRARGVRRVLRQQLGGHRPGDRALAGPAGAVEQIRVRGLAARRERGAEHRPGMWMAFQFREHISMLAPDTLGPDHHGSGQADHDRGDRRGGQVDARRRPRGGPRRARDCRAAPARAGWGPGSRAHPRAGHGSRAANRRACRSTALRRRSRAARRGGAAPAA